jgi:hypothetical protein
VRRCRPWLRESVGDERRLQANGGLILTGPQPFMADIPSHTFIIAAADQDNVKGRAIRRIFLSTDAMKLEKWFAGDLVVLTAAQVGASALGMDILSKSVSCLETVRCRDVVAFIRFSR